MRRFLVLSFLLSLAACGMFSTVKPGDVSSFSKHPIFGFEQLEPWRTDTSLLGSVRTPEGAFPHQAWTGRVSETAVTQVMRVVYEGKDALSFSVKVLKVAAASYSNSRIVKVQLEIENPAVIRLVDPVPAKAFRDDKDLLAKPYVAELLRAGRIRVQLYDEQGRQVKASANLRSVSGSLKFDLDRKQEAVLCGENAVVGYKLVTPGEGDADRAGKVALDYQFTCLPKGAERWQVLESRDTIRSGDELRIRLKFNQPVHCYLFNVDGDGKAYPLFPNPRLAQKNPLVADRLYSLPPDDTKTIRVDTTTGTEEFYFLVFRNPSPEAEKLYAEIVAGKVSRESLKGNPLVGKMRGMSYEDNSVIVTKPRDLPGFRLPARRLTGLPTDFLELFVLRHE